MNPVTLLLRTVPRLLGRVRALLFLPALVLLFAGIAWAQSDEHPTVDQQTVNGWRATLAQSEAALRRPSLLVGELDQLRDQVQAVLDAARDLNALLAPRIADLEERLATLAPPDASGEMPEAVKGVHDELDAQYQALKGLAQQVELVVLEAEQLIETIKARRDAQFTERLFARDRSVLSPELWSEVVEQTSAVLSGAGRVLSDWAAHVASSSDRTAIELAVLAIGLIATLLVARHLFIRWARGWTAGQPPTPRRRLLMAMAVVVTDIGVPVLILLGLQSLLDGLGLLPPTVAIIFRGIIVSVAVFTVIGGLARALAAPGQPEWRIGGISNQTARQTYSIVLVAAFLLALGPLVNHLAEATAAPPDYAVAVGGILSVPNAILAILATRALVRGRGTLTETERQRSARWRILTPLAAAAAIVTIVAAVAGYLAFARFMIEQIAWVWVVAGAYVLATGLADQAIGAIFQPGEADGRHFGRALGVSERAQNQLGVVLAGLTRIVLLILAALMVLAPWGFNSTSLTSNLEALYYGVEVGSIRITFTSIFAALAIFVVVVVLSRIFQRWLQSRFLPTTGIDPGLKNSIQTAAGYIGLILAVILAASYAGFDLASIAIVAGALSVGIGFGLQSIVNNFVSGLILLAERPIRTGDWISVGTEEGMVRRISVRATEIETFDHAAVIIPNSNLISGVVKNWFLRDNSGRTSVTVGVSDRSDPEAVRAILLDIAEKHELVLKSPRPFVTLDGFVDSALVFQLFAFLGDISTGLTVRSDLRFAIVRRLREAGIETPVPQRDVTISGRPPTGEAIQGIGTKDT